MKMPALFLSVVLLVSNAVGSNADARKDVDDAFKRFIVAFNNLDWDEFRRALSDDVTVFNPDIPEVPSVDRLDGRREVESGFKTVFDASRKQANGPPYLHIVPRNVRIQMLQDTAIVSFEFDRGGDAMGRRTIIFHREKRMWKIVHIHASNVTKRS